MRAARSTLLILRNFRCRCWVASGCWRIHIVHMTLRRLLSTVTCVRPLCYWH